MFSGIPPGRKDMLGEPRGSPRAASQLSLVRSPVCWEREGAACAGQGCRVHGWPPPSLALGLAMSHCPLTMPSCLSPLNFAKTFWEIVCTCS